MIRGSFSLRRIENYHIGLWLLKDTCWLLGWHTPALGLAVPTMAMALYLTWRFRRMLGELVHNIAVCCWIVANVIWMTGEFFYEDTLRPYAAVFFLSGLGVIGGYYLVLLIRPDLKLETVLLGEPIEELAEVNKEKAGELVS